MARPLFPLRSPSGSRYRVERRLCGCGTLYDVRVYPSIAFPENRWGVCLSKCPACWRDYVNDRYREQHPDIFACAKCRRPWASRRGGYCDRCNALWFCDHCGRGGDECSRSRLWGLCTACNRRWHRYRGWVSPRNAARRTYALALLLLLDAVSKPLDGDAALNEFATTLEAA